MIRCIGWGYVPHDLLQKADFDKIKQIVKKQYGSRPGATQDFNALRDVLYAPSQHIWITFEDGCMWWCTVHDGVTVNENGETSDRGYFWLKCASPWSKTSVRGKLLTISDLPGTITATAGVRATVCKPQAWDSILRIIQDETDPDVTNAARARRDYEQAIEALLRRLSPKDFELLIDLILARTGWERVSAVGGVREGIDIEAENPTTSEVAFVQVKGRATQNVLNHYVKQFEDRRDHFARMIFAVHSPSGDLTPPADIPVQVWSGKRVAELVVHLGLGKWVENKLP